MIAKITELLLSKINMENAPKNLLSRIYLGGLNLFGFISMFVTFLVAIFSDNEIKENVWWLLVIASIYATMFFYGRRLPNMQASILGLVVTTISSLALFFVINKPDYSSYISLGFSHLIPVYAVLCMNISLSLVISVFVAGILSAIYIISDLVFFDLISSIFYFVSMALICLITEISISYCNSLVEKHDFDAKRLQADISKKQKFISKLSHRIRTPLSNILGITNILSEQVSNNQKPLIESLLTSVKTITEIVEMIDGESDSSVPKQVTVEESNTISTFNLLKLITLTGELTKNVEVKLEVSGQLPRFKGDPVKIRQIFQSLFDFLLQNTPNEQLPVNVAIAINRVRIPVTPIKYRFDLRTSVNMSDVSVADSAELKIAKRHIESLNGSFKHRFDEENAYIYFNICFDGEEQVFEPIATVHNDDADANSTSGYTATARKKDLSESNIIVCDDNPINQKVMSLSLDKHVRSITLAANGQECVDLIAKNSYDLVLMDIQMPVLDGYSATKKIRDSEVLQRKHLPIIAVTANTLAGDKQHCLEVGMDDYVSKPFQLDDVLNKMRILIEKYPQA